MSHALGFEPGFNFMTAEVKLAWRDHALAQFPKEACAFVTKRGFRAVENIHEDPKRRFRIKDTDYLQAAQDGILAFLHTHTKLPEDRTCTDAPSEADMTAQMAWAVPWGISRCDGETVAEPGWFGDQVPRAPLVGRPFKHGVWDCYALIRDWYFERGVALPNFPRDDEWWTQPGGGRNFYETCFEEAGFEKTGDEIREGDVFVCAVRSGGIMNHAGVYVGNGLLLHHISGALSCHSPANLWAPKIAYLLRYKKGLPR